MRVLKFKSAALLLFVMALVSTTGTTARAQALVADLSSHHVAITTGFTGADVLLFGAVDGAGDIVVVITGPPENVAVRNKQRIAGIWVNANTVEFEGVPNFYAVASSRPLDEITTPDIRETQQIGAVNIATRVASRDRNRPAEELTEFREALIRNKQKSGLFSTTPEEVRIIADRLFRTKIHFPSNMATGNYTAVVYLFREGSAVQAVSTPILVEKVGLGAEVYNFAHQQSALYGLAAIVIAVFSGWLGSVIFRKV
jgi:uncharacterized protein (TIGR02186 family)